jgi:hypothetical protein
MGDVLAAQVVEDLTLIQDLTHLLSCELSVNPSAATARTRVSLDLARSALTAAARDFVS